jgi:hypothetical protein
MLGESADLLDSTRSTLLEGNTVRLKRTKKEELVFRPNAILMKRRDMMLLLRLAAMRWTS